MVDSARPDPRNLPIRGIFIIGPDGCLNFSSFYPVNTGCNIVELVRIIDSLQLTMEYDLATPVNWKQGETCYLRLNATEAKTSRLPNKIVPVAVPSGISYLNKIDMP